MHKHESVKEFKGRNSLAQVRECGCGSRSYLVDGEWSKWKPSQSAQKRRIRQNMRNAGLI